MFEIALSLPPSKQPLYYKILNKNFERSELKYLQKVDVLRKIKSIELTQTYFGNEASDYKIPYKNFERSEPKYLIILYSDDLRISY